MNNTPIIVGISGRKQAGKSTLAGYLSAFLYGEVLPAIGSYHYTDQDIKNTSILKIRTDIDPWLASDRAVSMILSSPTLTNTIFDEVNKHYHALTGKGDDFVKTMSFATPIKDLCVSIFGVSRESVDGTDEQKNAPIHISWDTVSPNIREKHGNPTGFLTGRKLMQIVGSDLMREQLYPDTWVDALIHSIRNFKTPPKIVFVPDVRLVNEADAILKAGGYLIRLTRSPFPNDNHSSEIALDGYDWNRPNCFVINNENKTLSDKNNGTEEVAAVLKTLLKKNSI